MANVYDYETGNKLSGNPSDRLVKESLSEGYGGAVLAYYEEAEKEWAFIDASDKRHYQNLGFTVRTVYVAD